MAEPLRAIKGMNDILPPESGQWEWLEETVRQLMRRYGYQNIRTPIVEPTALFERGLGEVTDIVEKEMYAFEDSLNGDRLTLRPEGTAGVVRAMNEHNFLYEGARRLFYIGPMFRHERPQKGRYRQFHQVGVEALGFAGADVDAEIILMTAALWRDLGLTVGEDVRLEINSLGQTQERQAHREALIEHLQAHQDQLDDEGRRRLLTNPLRILDSKHPAAQAVIESAPRLMDFLGEESLAHFKALRDVLDAAGLTYRINPRLVRGMDYYNLTVFEWVTDKLGSQGTVCGGGRYDGLMAQLGGKPTPAVGWGLGLERLLLLLAELGKTAPIQPAHAYAVVMPGVPVATVMPVLESLRGQGVQVIMHPLGKDGPASPKAQFKKADASGALFALVFGPDEIAAGQLALKDLRQGQPQCLLPLNDVAAWSHRLLQQS